MTENASKEISNVVENLKFSRNLQQLGDYNVLFKKWVFFEKDKTFNA